MMGSGLELLAWDTGWLGFPVARLADAPLCAPVDVAGAVAQCRAAGVRLLYLVLNPANTAAASVACTVGAHLADVKLIYELPPAAPGPPATPPDGVRLVATTVLTPALERLAWQSGEYSRFRTDERFGPRAFKELYSRWLRQALEQGIVWTALEEGGEAVGLLAYGLRGGQASIELVAVAASAQRRRIGRCLVQAAQDEAQRRGHAALQVVTQGANVPARKFYERCGFQLKRTEHVYHLWL